jgi:hypothetical protein
MVTLTPTTTNGTKLFTAATAEQTIKLSATLAHSKAFIDEMRVNTAKFGWGKLTSNIDVGDGVTKNILEDFEDLDLEKVRLAVNPIFYNKDVTNTTLPSLINKPKMFSISPETNDEDKVIFFKQV